MSKPHPGRISTSMPPSPMMSFNLSKDNADFYAEPKIDEPKKKPSGMSQSLFPSPTLQTAMLDVRSLPEAPGLTDDSVQPTVAFTAATPIRPHPSKVDLEGQQPFLVNTADILSRPASSTSIGLTENARRGLEKIKRLSSEGYSGYPGYSISREGSPVNGLSSVERENAKTKIYSNEIEELRIHVGNLKSDLVRALEDKERAVQAYKSLQHDHSDVKAKLAKREHDYDVMSKNYLEHVRLIRATDDDHSTIMERLNQLRNGIEHLVRAAQGIRSSFLNQEQAIDHFKNTGKLAAFPVGESDLQPFHLNMYMESVIMSTLVTCFFEQPLNCIFDFNEGFQGIYDWMYERNARSAVRWRQQLCQMLANDPKTKVRQAEEVDKAAAALTELVSKVYRDSNMTSKIRDICIRAFELAVAMTGMESAISPVYVPLGTNFEEDTMVASPKSNCDGKVAMVIFPSFQDTAKAFNTPAKVWCC
ncbi:hypothetical protein BG004_002549 [Podila humilis]|nr:hypothetical protein BG004_002549 [Podila humilis]